MSRGPEQGGSGKDIPLNPEGRVGVYQMETGNGEGVQIEGSGSWDKEM